MSFARTVVLPLWLAAGCLGDTPAPMGPGGPGPAAPGRSVTPAGPNDVLTSGADPTPPPTGPTDLGAAPPGDLAGLVNCYGVAVCDPSLHFCIQFFSGSQAAPGAPVSSAACYQPTDTCANQGQPMTCACIQADPSLGTGCQGSCLDHGDGTYFCYAQ